MLQSGMHVARSHSELLHSLQIGRAVAALCVVLNHAMISAHTLYPQMPILAQEIAVLGHLGVDYFFVLSGFIIAYVTREMRPTRNDARRYFLSRLSRIYVPYLPIGLAMFIGFTFFPALSMGARGQESLWASLLLPSSTRPALWAGWTLQHELVFYTLFGLCLFLGKRSWLIFLWAVPILLASNATFPRIGHILVGAYNLEFLMGVAACFCYRRQWLRGGRHLLIAAGALLVLGVCVALVQQAGFVQINLLAGAGFAMLMLGLVYMESTINFARYRLLIYLGAASYAIYLVHGPTNSLLMRLLPLGMGWPLSVAVMFAGSMVIGIGYFHCIEQPLMRRVRRYSRQ